jgi:RimJ/RimL family protein N-acetyltransferase
MLHNIILEGPAFRIRPVEDSDAAFVVKLRQDTGLNRFLHATAPDINSQLAWLEKYYAREDEWYFVIERRSNGVLEGLISIYDVNPQRSSAEWGRWILRHGSLAAVESAWLIYYCAFNEIGLHEVYCRTIRDNEAVVSFHDSCGISCRTLLPRYTKLNGLELDVVEHRVDRAGWRVVGPRLEQLAQVIARRLQREF